MKRQWRRRVVESLNSVKSYNNPQKTGQTKVWAGDMPELQGFEPLKSHGLLKMNVSSMYPL